MLPRHSFTLRCMVRNCDSVKRSGCFDCNLAISAFPFGSGVCSDSGCLCLQGPAQPALVAYLARIRGYSSATKPLPPAGHFLAAPMRNFLVPQATHWPVTAGRPFFRTTSWASRVSVLLRHLKQ